ncbi:MAG: type 1 glutamine amidotransferase, partial [Flavobacteriales bacterium]|nr:type 1 glutamine amidotransferase [Flavobacteriales bacterium]
MKQRKTRGPSLATDGFEESELRAPREALLQAGAFVDLISLEAGAIKGWKDGDWGEAEQVDRTVADANAEDYDALLPPGGVMNPDKLRMDTDAVAFVRLLRSAQTGGAICHGPWRLAEAGVLRGRKLTSYPSIRTDLTNAGAEWGDEEVVVDNGLITSRSPEDLPAFNAKMVEEIAEGVHQGVSGAEG